MMSAAEAPSVRKDDVAAVTVPWGLTNAGLSAASFSRVPTRTPLSFSTASATPGTATRRTSVSLPASWAFCAKVCERMANSSCSRRETPNAEARRSAECPMISFVENSAMPGSSSPMSLTLSLLRRAR
eukprot:Amastigsp_a341718_117.p4 type:complete len:128 gc:universal Amastigsp_a341718_117:934-551(-)